MILHWGGKSEREHLPADVWDKKFRAELIFYRIHYSVWAVFGICLENLIQAIWRIISLNLTIPFSAHKNLLQHKLVKYRIAFRVFWGALRALKSGKTI